MWENSIDVLLPGVTFGRTLCVCVIYMFRGCKQFKILKYWNHNGYKVCIYMYDIIQLNDNNEYNDEYNAKYNDEYTDKYTD